MHPGINFRKSKPKLMPTELVCGRKPLPPHHPKICKVLRAVHRAASLPMCIVQKFVPGQNSAKVVLPEIIRQIYFHTQPAD